MTFGATPFRPARIMASGLILLALAGCARKSGEAVVLEKEHIAAAEIHETPATAPGKSITSPTPSPESATTDEGEAMHELKPGEIVVDGYVMERDVRGTSKDPRATTNEQWIVRVELISGGRKIDVHTDRVRYEKVKPGDRVEVAYREGKYTGTVWNAEIK